MGCFVSNPRFIERGTAPYAPRLFGLASGAEDPPARRCAATPAATEREERMSTPATASPRTGTAPGLRRHVCQIFTCEVVLASRGEPLVPNAEGERRLRVLEERFSRFRADSEISRLNRSPGSWCDISEEMYALLKLALDAAVASGGLVNIAVLPRLVEAGYAGTWPFDEPRGPEPAPAAPVER